MMLLVVGALYVGNKACEPCHQQIVRSYGATPMANSSGRVVGGVPAGAGGLQPGAFRHPASSANYQIGAAGNVHVATPAGEAEWSLDYFIGSGAAGRSFLFANGGFLFQAPVTWYSRQARWDVSPGYEKDRVSRWNRAIEPECLGCHASQVRFAQGYQNRYADPPFTQDGIGCERCHGPGSEHIAGKGALINPAKLDAERRDSVCAQCHMSGAARVTRAGKNFLDYRPGEALSSYVSYFVSAEGAALKATSYVEKLAASRCKMASGDRLWCGTCHDPHTVPAAQERASWFRGKCQTCHTDADCARGPDCASCHMPKGAVQDVAHGVLTDHSIPKNPAAHSAGANSSWRLQGFSKKDAGDRELGLAYAEVFSQTGDARQAQEAFRLLKPARDQNDRDIELRLAGLYQSAGDSAKAAEIYEAVLQREPGSLVALVNLGNCYGSQGALDKAAALWRRALLRNPCQAESVANLRTVYVARGDLKNLDLLRASQVKCLVGGQ